MYLEVSVTLAPQDPNSKFVTTAVSRILLILVDAVNLQNVNTDNNAKNKIRLYTNTSFVGEVPGKPNSKNLAIYLSLFLNESNIFARTVYYVEENENWFLSGDGLNLDTSAELFWEIISKMERK